MAKTIREQNPPIFDFKKTTNGFGLTRTIILKSFIDVNRDSLEFLIIKDHIDNLIDEPVIFVVKQKDKLSIKLSKLFYNYKEMSLCDIFSLKKEHTTVLFIVGEYNPKMMKIIEIICNKVFNKSILII